ncbi:dTDP-4-dehydrorhamnose reductase [Bradyrhizobium sp. CCGUVB1N3]|uniref:dTDP-4-dehydrorhamnose reductase n=1 Tax=Bradyrhizobium sp. CCGUVB1N3 TaxID=2949629 RepID=UPI0020B3BA5E|nr:dTDP-4-dehydrorhamnose reductase [Bradyrhizobium sp. CCGUVB1N3]MCP3475567.1 dTDP-4-dehydrorhamnose reductase [Bradyrhizobium sp. CCGUVB1N3]
MRLYVIGTKGQVSRSLRELAAFVSDLVIGFASRPELDLARPQSVARAITSFRPDIVINPAAYTAVDRAETEPDQAYAINRDAAGEVAKAANAIGATIIHLSTDYVFDGKKPGPYVETDQPNPQGAYGRSKLEGELAVAAANPRHVILRTSWIYAPFGHNFLRTMLKVGAERECVRVVDDQRGCPTYAPDIAASIVSIARRLRHWQQQYSGVTHLAGLEAMTWHQFAGLIFSESAKRAGPSAAVEPISSAEYPTAALRPANSQLSTERLRSLFEISLPPTPSSISACLDRISHEEKGL